MKSKFKIISIIVPVYNEEKTVEEVLRKLAKVKLPLKKEIICVDDGSSDSSAKIIKRFIKNNKSNIHYFYKKNGGKGSALIFGFKKAKGDILTVQDADLEYNPSDFKKLIKPILDKKTSVVYGSRYNSEKGHLKDNMHMTFQIHRIGNKMLSYITTLLFLQKMGDMETCYKMFTREVYEKLNLKANDFRIEPEITAQIIKNGYKIKELPISYFSRDFNEGKKITWKDGFKAFLAIIKFGILDNIFYER